MFRIQQLLLTKTNLSEKNCVGVKINVKLHKISDEISSLISPPDIPVLQKNAEYTPKLD
jgi:hypothetical protein